MINADKEKDRERSESLEVTEHAVTFWEKPYSDLYCFSFLGYTPLWMRSLIAADIADM